MTIPISTTLSSLHLLLLLAPLASADQIKTLDPYIYCIPNQVPNNQNGLPRQFSPTEYFHPLRLCSALNGAAKTVGCVCTSSDEHSFGCHYAIADRSLWNAVIPSSGKGFPQWCHDTCSCRPETPRPSQGAGGEAGADEEEDVDDEDMEGDYEGGAYEDERAERARGSSGSAGVGALGGDENFHDPDDAGIEIFVNGSYGEGWVSAVPVTSTTATAATTVMTTPPQQQRVSGAGNQSVCGNGCTSQGDCGGECTCSTQAERFVPGLGLVAFVARCILSLAGGGGRGGSKLPRGVGRPCPCNASYVSFGCCGVEDGVVWEGEGEKLGVLMGWEGG